MPRKKPTNDRLDSHRKEEDLPPCEGPKLSIFQHHGSPIEWLDRLDYQYSDESDDESKESYVFKVKIKSQLYALKIFRPLDLDEDREFWEYLVKDEQILQWHTDAFYAECRAYGRIREQGLAIQDELAVPCFGYIYLTDRDNRELEKRGIDVQGLLHYDIGTDGSLKPPRIRGIVKELAPPTSGLTSSTIRKIRRTLVKLNKLRIYNRDVREDNFRGGRLVDFGLSWTEPHCFMMENNAIEAGRVRMGDLAQFDDMVDKASIVSQWRITPNVRYLRKLRSYTRKMKETERRWAMRDKITLKGVETATVKASQPAVENTAPVLGNRKSVGAAHTRKKGR